MINYKAMAWTGWIAWLVFASTLIWVSVKSNKLYKENAELKAVIDYEREHPPITYTYKRFIEIYDNGDGTADTVITDVKENK